MGAAGGFVTQSGTDLTEKNRQVLFLSVNNYRQQLPSQQLIQEMMTWCLQEVIRKTQTKRESRQRCTFPFKTCNSRNIFGAFECLSHIAVALRAFLTEKRLQCGRKYATLSHSKASKFAPLPAQLDIIGVSALAFVQYANASVKPGGRLQVNSLMALQHWIISSAP